MPFRDGSTVQEALDLFLDEVPALQLLGATDHNVDEDVAFTVDSDVQLVCKYLRAYKASSDNSQGIDRLYREGGRQVKFSTEPNLKDEDCHSLLQEFMPLHITPHKITQQLFIR